HGNDLVNAGNFGGDGPEKSTNTAAGVGAVYFDGGSYLTAPSNLLARLAGSYTISLWVKTSDTSGAPDDYAYNGAGIICADDPNPSNDQIPVALTAGQVAFNTPDSTLNYDETLNSGTVVNDDIWHHIVVTRDQSSGEKIIYIDGVLDTYSFGTTNLLNGVMLLTIGCKAD